MTRYFSYAVLAGISGVILLKVGGGYSYYTEERKLEKEAKGIYQKRLMSLPSSSTKDHEQLSS